MIIRGAIGPKIGPTIGPAVGTRVGLQRGSSMAGVTRDAASGKYFPSTNAEWTATMAAAGISSGNPSFLWLLQEASGNLADTIGLATLTNTGSLTYQNAVAGYTRKAMSCPNTNGAYILFNNTEATLPDTQTESMLLIQICGVVGVPGGDRGVCLIGGSNMRALVTAAGAPKAVTASTNATGAANVSTDVRPWVLQHNVTGSVMRVCTDQEVVTPTFAASASGKKAFLGGGVEGTAGLNILYAVAFKGTAAELSSAQIKTLLQTLGWTIAW